ncbi:MAG: trigger factor [Campylobacteraceae bacterium]|nr:trigger factor [Campylobacteraceae bacterium]
MEFNAKKVNTANAVVTATITKAVIDTNINKLAKEAAKTMDIQGFRKGKVPAHIVKARYGDKLVKDAESDALRAILSDALKELAIADDALIGEPTISKFDKQDSGDIEIEIKVANRPQIDLGDYKGLLPEVKLKKVAKKDLDAKLQEIASQGAELTKIARKRMVKDQDYTLIDFEGFVDGVAFDGGKGEGHSLQIGSNSFIPGFEDQIIGMKYEETKDVVVTFPAEYQSKDLAGKEATFKVTLIEIQEKKEVELTDEFAAKMLPDEKDATVATLTAKIEENMVNETKSVYYRDELKPAYLDTLVESLAFDLPESVVDQEVNYALNNKVKELKEDEVKALQDDAKKVDAMRDDLREDAAKSVKATFIIDALAKAEGVEINDQEVSQVIYYEAMQMGQNPQDVLKQYQEAGYLPAIKMSMIEDRVISKLLDEKLGK